MADGKYIENSKLINFVVVVVKKHSNIVLKDAAVFTIFGG